MNAQEFREFLDKLTDEQRQSDLQRQLEQQRVLIDYANAHGYSLEQAQPPPNVSKAKLRVGIGAGNGRI